MIVAAKSQAEAARAFDVSVHEFRSYGSATSNVREVAVANTRPGIVFERPLDDRNAEYTEVLR
jgi:hypothetical protein